MRERIMDAWRVLKGEYVASPPQPLPAPWQRYTTTPLHTAGTSPASSSFTIYPGDKT